MMPLHVTFLRVHKTMNMRRLLPIFVCGLSALLSGCVMSTIVATVSGDTVTVLDDSGFRSLAQRFKPALQAKRLLDGDGNWVEPLVSLTSAPADAGNRLFRRLSPAFRFQRTDAAQAPATFTASRVEGDELAMSSRGFSLVQGTRRVSVSLIALADWNGDGKDDWIVRCAVRASQPPTDGFARDYYLVITNPDAALFRPQMIGVYDCHNQNCVAYADGRNCPPEDLTVDLRAGQRIVTAPPAKPGKDRKPDALQEKKLRN
jgi:hypothetical protein